MKRISTGRRRGPDRGEPVQECSVGQTTFSTPAERWPTDRRVRLARSAGTVVAGAFFILTGLGIGFLAVNDRKYAVLLLGLFVLLALLARSPVLLAALVLASVFNTTRVSLGNGISLPDLVLGMAMVLSFPILARMKTPAGLSGLRRWFLVYAGAMLISCVAHPRYEGFIEIGHRAMLVLGAAGVGAWIYTEGRARFALRLFYGLAVVFAFAAIVAGAAHGFHHPAQPLKLNKNYLGSILGMALLVGIAGADEVKIPPQVRNFSLLLLGGGLAATQSRLSMIGLGVGALVWAIKSRPRMARDSRGRRKVSKLGFLVIAAVIAVAATSLNSQFGNKEATKNTNSIAVRNLTEKATRQLWHQSPVIGNGVYYYYHNPALTDQNIYLVAPNNSIDEALAEGGIVLAAAFIIFHLGALRVLFRSRGTLAVLGLALVVDRIVHGMGDIYWTAGTAALPWVVAGMGLAQSAELRKRDQSPGASEPAVQTTAQAPASLPV